MRAGNLDDPEATAEVNDDGRLHPGDVGVTGRAARRDSASVWDA